MKPLFLYLDAETIPSQNPDVRFEIDHDPKYAVDLPDYDAIKPDARLKDPEKIADDLVAKRAKAQDDFKAACDKSLSAGDAEWRKTSFDGGRGHVACVSFAVNDRPIQNARNFSLSSMPDTPPYNETLLEFEKNGLLDLFEKIEDEIKAAATEAAEREWDRMVSRRIEGTGMMKHPHSEKHVVAFPTESREEWIAAHVDDYLDTPVFVAHNTQFDLRFIWQRAIILGVTPPAWWPIDAKPWDDTRVHDTMTMWAGHGNRISLDRLCRTFNLPGKSGIDGSKVWDAIAAGRIDEVVEYCDDDVRRLRLCHRKIARLPISPVHSDDWDRLIEREEAQEGEAA